MTRDLSAPARTVEEHAGIVARMLEALSEEPAAETVPLDRAVGRVTVDELRSEVDLPLFRNSQMDGYAVRRALNMPAHPCCATPHTAARSSPNSSCSQLAL